MKNDLKSNANTQLSLSKLALVLVLGIPVLMVFALVATYVVIFVPEAIASEYDFR